MIKTIRNIGIFALTALAVTACTRVEPGHVGVRENVMGSNRGIQQEELQPGMVWHGFGVNVHQFETFEQNYTWTVEEGEEFEFNDAEGIELSAEIGVSYRIVSTEASVLFERYRSGLDEVTDIYIRNHVRDAIIAEASIMDVEEIYGAGRAELLARVEETVRAQLDPIGINLSELYWIGRIDFPVEIEQAINNKIAATQRAQQRENELREAEAQAAINVTEAQGVADAARIAADAEAYAIRVQAEALRLSPEVIRLREIEKWDGVLPTYIGNGSPVPIVNP